MSNSTAVNDSTAMDPVSRKLAGHIFNYEKLTSIFVFIFVACGAIGVIEPSPYDFASMIALPVWFFGGFTIHRSFIVFGALIIGYMVMGFLALIPYWDNANSALYQYQSAYLVLTGLFYALYMGERSFARVELSLKAYTVGCLVAALTGILGYFNIAGLGEIFAYAGRASGTFKDPNVLGSYLLLSINYLALNLTLGRARSIFLDTALLLIIFAGMFLSFSRGSYGAAVFSFGLMIASVFFTSSNLRTKRRIVIGTTGAVVLVAIVIVILLSTPETREFFTQRTAAAQDYDQGETGRFGNQIRSIPMLLDSFMGFGPLRFRLIFGLDPHNSYVGAFANNGWIGGFLFLLLVGATVFIGVRLMFNRSPYQRQAQIVAPTLFALFLQGFQIDIDHWRFVFFMLGIVWGLEAARLRWLDQGRPSLNPPSHSAAAPVSSRPPMAAGP